MLYAQAEDRAVPVPCNKRKRSSTLVQFYHAGMIASQRKKIQNDFMRGDLKIVVATIAFGNIVVIQYQDQIFICAFCL